MTKTVTLGVMFTLHSFSVRNCMALGYQLSELRKIDVNFITKINNSTIARVFITLRFYWQITPPPQVSSSNTHENECLVASNAENFPQFYRRSQSMMGEIFHQKFGNRRSCLILSWNVFISVYLSDVSRAFRDKGLEALLNANARLSLSVSFGVSLRLKHTQKIQNMWLWRNPKTRTNTNFEWKN